MAKKYKKKQKVEKPKKKVRKKKPVNDVKKAEKILEKAAKAETEKELKQKCKDLASIIEEMSTATEEIPVTKVEDILQPKLKEVAQVFDEQLKGLKETLETLEKKMEKPTKLKGQVSGAASRIEEKIEPRIASIEEQMKALDKIAEIEKKFNELTGETKDGKRVPKLSILENRVIKAMQEDLLEVKEAVQNLYHSFNMMRDKTQKKIQKIQETLTPETLQKLHELIAFLDKAVPSKVKEEVGDKFNTVFDRLRELDKNVSGLEKRMNKILKEVSENEQKFKVIKDIKASLAELYVEKDNLYKIAENIRAESARSDDGVELKFQSNIDQVIKRFDEFDVVISNYLKDVQKKLNKTISEFSKTQLLALEKRYLKKLSPIKEDIKDLQIDLSKFQNLVNSTFESVRDSLDKLNLQLQRMKETDKEEHLKLKTKLMEQLEKFVSEPKHYSGAVEGAVEKFFSEIAESKLKEIENEYVAGISSAKDGVNNLDTRVSNFENFVNSNLDSLKIGMDKFNVQLQKLREDEIREILKLDKKIKSQKVQFEGIFKSYPKVIRDNVEKLFSSLAESKLVEIEKKHHIDLNFLKNGVDDLETRMSGFENVVNSTFDSVGDTVEKLKLQLEKTREKEILERLKYSKKLMARVEKFMGDPKNYSKAVEGSMDKFFVKFAEPKLSDMGKNLQEEIITFGNTITDLQSKLSGFENLVNSNFSSIRGDIDSFDFRLQKLKEDEKKELLKLEKIIKAGKVHLEDTLKAYPKVIKDNVEEIFSSLAESKLVEIEKKHHIDLISVKKGVDDLETKIAGFENVVNSTFGSVSDSLEKLDVKIEKLKQKDIQNHQKFEKKLMTQVEKFVSDPKNYSKVIGKEVDKLFSSIAQSKLLEIEKDYKDEISSVVNSVNDLQSQLSSFKTDATSTFDLLKGSVDEFSVQLQKLREDEEKEHLKIEKKVKSDITDFKDILKTYPKVVKDNVEKFFKSMAESKLAEIEKKHHIDLISVKSGVDGLETNIAGFESNVNSTFNSVNDSIEKLKVQLEKTREKEELERQKFGRKLFVQVEKFMGDPKNYSKAVEGSMDKFFAKLAEPKLLEMQRNLHEEVASFEVTITDLKSKLSDFESLVNSNFSSIRDDISNFDFRLQKLKEDEKKELLKLEKRIKAEKYHLEDILKSYPKVIKDSVEKIFSSLAESKLAEIEKKHHIDLVSLKKGLDGLDTKVADFESNVNSTFDSVSDSMEKLRVQLEKTREQEELERSKFSKKLIAQVEKFMSDPKNYSKVIGKEVDKLFASMAKSKLSEMDGKYVTRISYIKDGLDNLDGRLSSFENLVNSTLDSVKGNTVKLNIQLQKLREDEEKERLKFEKKIKIEKVELEHTLKSYPRVIKENVEKFFSSMAETKLAEIEKKHHGEISSVVDSVDDLQSRLSSLSDDINSSFNPLRDDIDKFNLRLEKIKYDEEKEHLKIENKIKSDIAKFNDTLKSYPKVIKDNVGEFFSSLAESKLAEIEKKHHIDLLSVKNGVDGLETKIAEFENAVNSTFDSVRGDTVKLNVQLQKLKEQKEEKQLKFEKKVKSDIARFNDTLKSYPKVIKNTVEYFFSNLAESKFSEVEKKHYKNLSTVQENVNVLQSDLSKLENEINSGVESVRDDINKFDLKFQKLREERDKERLILEKKLASEVAVIKQMLNAQLKKAQEKNRELYVKLDNKIADSRLDLEQTLKNYPHIIEDTVNDLFSKLAEAKLSEIEEKHSGKLASIEEKSKVVESKLTDLSEKSISSIKSLDKEIEKMKNQFKKLEKIQFEFPERGEIVKLKKQFEKLIEGFTSVKTVKEYIKKSVYRDISTEFKDKMGVVSLEMASFRNDLKEISSKLKHLDTVDKKIVELQNQRTEFLEELQEQKSRIGIGEEKTRREFEKKLESDRARFEELVKKIASEKKSLEELIKKQKQKISSYLEELKT